MFDIAQIKSAQEQRMFFASYHFVKIPVREVKTRKEAEE